MNFDYFLAIGVTILLQVLNDAPESSKRRKMILKIFRQIVDRFNQDAEFRKIAQEGFK